MQLPDWPSEWLLRELMPPIRRGRLRLESYLRVLYGPIERMRGEVRDLYQSLLLQISVSAQKLSLERHLNLTYYGSYAYGGINPIRLVKNDRFTLPQGYLFDPNDPINAYLFDPADATPTTYLFDPSDYAQSQVVERVLVPESLEAADAVIRARIDRYAAINVFYAIERYA